MATAIRNRKKIVILCDGTWNEPDANSPTNVVKLARCIAPQDSTGVVQSIFYDQGVGTEGGMDKYLGGAFGMGVGKNVLDGYRYLVHNYREGDDIFLFGFSRGGYTARAIAGMVGCIGLLDKKNLGELGRAYKYYRTHPDERGPENFSVGLKPDIQFVGVFDTVGALGAPSHLGKKFSKRWVGFFDTTLSKKVLNAYQALAMDEYRTLFSPDIWVGSTHEKQTVEQCWFRGAHSDIGGGYDNSELSDIALNWLATAARQCGLECSNLPASPASIHAEPNDSMTLMYKSLGLIGKGKLDRLKELSFPDLPAINLTAHPSVAALFSEKPAYARLWHTGQTTFQEQRHSPRVVISQVESRPIHLIQGTTRVNATLLDINDSFGMRVQCDRLDQLPANDFEVRLPGMKPMSLHRVWEQDKVVGLH